MMLYANWNGAKQVVTAEQMRVRLPVRLPDLLGG